MRAEGPWSGQLSAQPGETERRLKIYAIEKNPNAVVTLHKLVAAERSGQILG